MNNSDAHVVREFNHNVVESLLNFKSKQAMRLRLTNLTVKNVKNLPLSSAV